MHFQMQCLNATRRLTGLATLLICTSLLAQEGFPLDGTWRGQYGDPSAPNHFVIVMQWNGETINGRINPGPQSIDFDVAVLNPSNWTVRIEATDASGEPIVIEGMLRNIGSYNRSIDGTWTQGGAAQAFTMARE